MEKTKTSMLKTIFGMMINPSGILKSAMLSTKWYFSLIVSGLAFGLFFIQTGLDLYKTGQKGVDFLLLSAGVGILYGVLLIPLLGFLMAVILKISKSDKKIGQIISLFCLSYSGALIYGTLGIVFSLALGWKTSIAFGVSGVLWAIGPTIVTIREMTGGKNTMSIPIATIISGAILVSWSFFGNL
ncbi:hypothetical protein JCM17380_19650 [Desulfosporosinus burensis]